MKSKVLSFLEKRIPNLKNRNEKDESIKDKNRREILLRLKTGEDVVFISSYPRSGNRWTRQLISDCLLQQRGIQTTSRLPIHPDRIIPDLYANLISDRDLSIEIPNLLVKTHEKYSDLKKYIDSSEYPKQSKHIHIYRNPVDSLVSYYHFHLRYEHLKPKVECGIEQFCLSKFPDWSEHISGYLEEKIKNRDQIFLISYESLLLEPMNILKALFIWLNLPTEEHILQTAIYNTGFERLQKQELENPINKEEPFYRKGKIGSGKEELSKETYNILNLQAEELLKKANILLTEQVKKC